MSAPSDAAAVPSLPPRIVDAWINANVPAAAAVWHTSRHPLDVSTRVFAAGHRIGEGEPFAATVAAMDAAGISAGVLSSMREYSPFDDVMRFHELVAELAAEYPARFVCAGGVDPSAGPLAAARMARRLVEELGFRALKVMPGTVGAAPNHRMYYPLYAACCELGVPITVNVGFPGPRVPAEVQRPIHLDDVCRDLPELTVVMTHLGSPWHDEAIAMTLQHENCYLMTSAWAPRHYPQALVRHIDARGRGRVMFATDYPLLTFERCVTEAMRLPLRPEARADFLGGVATRVLLGG